MEQIKIKLEGGIMPKKATQEAAIRSKVSRLLV